jgi:hypothetical protein
MNEVNIGMVYCVVSEWGRGLLQQLAVLQKKSTVLVSAQRGPSIEMRRVTVVLNYTKSSHAVALFSRQRKCNSAATS